MNAESSTSADASKADAASPMKVDNQMAQSLDEGIPMDPPYPIEPPPSDTHACELMITFPTDLQAEQAMQVMQVDSEPTDRVKKAFRLEKREKDGEMIVSLVVRFESKELKMLRVAVSSFADYMKVLVQTMAEFGENES